VGYIMPFIGMEDVSKFINSQFGIR